MLDPKFPTARKKAVKESAIDAMGAAGTHQRYALAGRRTAQLRG
jgi:hypothetical protein